MKTYKPLVLLILLASLLVVGTRSAPTSGVLAAAVSLPFQSQPHAPIDHPSLKDTTVNSAPLRTFAYGAPRPDFYDSVIERRSAIICAMWVSPREGHKVLTIVREWKHTNRREVF